MVRRMLVRATTKRYNYVVTELVALLRKSDRERAGDVIERYLAGQTSESGYWPDDDEVRKEVATLKAYRRLGRGRLRMVLEAIEDHLRGWRDGTQGLIEERVPRGKLAIEHVMPRKWHTHWPLPIRRVRQIATVSSIPSATSRLLTGKLNSKVSNGPWAGAGGKRDALEAHDVLLLNRTLKAANDWTDECIRSRTRGPRRM